MLKITSHILLIFFFFCPHQGQVTIFKMGNIPTAFFQLTSLLRALYLNPFFMKPTAFLEHRSNNLFLCPDPSVSFHHIGTKVQMPSLGWLGHLIVGFWGLASYCTLLLLILLPLHWPFCPSEVPGWSLPPVLGTGRDAPSLHLHEAASFLSGRSQVTCHLFQEALPDTQCIADPRPTSTLLPCFLFFIVCTAT